MLIWPLLLHVSEEDPCLDQRETCLVQSRGCHVGRKKIKNSSRKWDRLMGYLSPTWPTLLFVPNRGSSSPRPTPLIRPTGDLVPDGRRRKRELWAQLALVFPLPDFPCHECDSWTDKGSSNHTCSPLTLFPLSPRHRHHPTNKKFRKESSMHTCTPLTLFSLSPLSSSPNK